MRTLDDTVKDRPMLRNRLICGMKNEATQRALLAEENLTHERAIEVATAREAAARPGLIVWQSSHQPN